MTIMLIILSMSFLPFFCKPPLPKITYGEFPFQLQYEVKGEQFFVEDTLICEYYINMNEGNGKSVQLKQRWMNDKSQYYIHTLYKIDDETIIQYISPGGKYFMGEPHEKGDFTKPLIRIVNTKTWHSFEPQNGELLEKYEFKVLNYECAKPIQNSFP